MFSSGCRHCAKMLYGLRLAFLASTCGRFNILLTFSVEETSSPVRSEGTVQSPERRDTKLGGCRGCIRAG